MSKSKKILISIILAVLIVLTYHNISKSAWHLNEYKSANGNYHLNLTKSEGYQEYKDNRMLFCIQHKQRLWSQAISYKVISIVRLHGDTATGPYQDPNDSVFKKTGKVKIKEKSITDWTDKYNDKGKLVKEGSKNINTKLSYVFSRLLFGSTGKTEVQESIWWFMDNWMNRIGKDFYGLSAGTASPENEGRPGLVDEAKAFAQRAKNGIDNVDAVETNIKVQIKDGSLEIGPIQWSFVGDLVGDTIEVRDENNQKISGVKFGVYNGNNFTQIQKKNIPSNQNFYLRIPINRKLPKKITAICGKIKIDDSIAEMIFLEPTSGSMDNWQNLMLLYVWDDTKRDAFSVPYDIILTGELNVIKVNSDDTTIPLNDVGFKFRNTTYDKYVYINAYGEVALTPDINSATVFITGKDGDTPGDGKITLEDLIVGEYEALEVVNPHYGYEKVESKNVKVEEVNDTTPKQIENPPVFIKLSGYVFLDVQSNKQSTRNNAYKSDGNDDQDRLLSGVKVRIVDTTITSGDNTAKDDNGIPFTAITRDLNLGGVYIRYYQFQGVRISNLGKYQIEFTYDGLTYQSVTPLQQKDLYYNGLTYEHMKYNQRGYTPREFGSIANENSLQRENFNKNFSTIKGSGNGTDTGVALNEAGNVAHNLQYNFNGQTYISTLKNDGLPIGKYPITASTSETGYSLLADYQVGDEEIPYINLGLYEREQPDLSIGKDIENVSLSINGATHLYKYAQRRFHQTGYTGSGFNVGVKWSSEYVAQSYSRAIYEADVEYVNSNDRSKELKVNIVYKIDIKNEASGIITRVNSISEYFDSRYTLKKVGTSVDGQGNVAGNIQYGQAQNYNNEYRKIVINPNISLNPQQSTQIYLQFELNREAVVSILNAKATLDNIVEIDSYSSFKDGKIYAGVDKDSNPGNIIIQGKEITKHDFDDTDVSPALILELAEKRTLSGKVFLDSTSNELRTGQIRQGDGQYKDGEAGIPDVEVTFKENVSRNGMTYKTKTVSESGYYEFDYTYLDPSGTEFRYNRSNHQLPAGTTVIVEPRKVSSKTEKSMQLGEGDFCINEYIPGNYTLTYTWGSKEYPVQDYKGTIYQKSRNQGEYWYKDNVNIRYTDAIDNYDTRKAIDEHFKEIDYNSIRGDDYYERGIDITMVSTTPKMKIEVEYDSKTSSFGDKLTYAIRNVDFGIVERARQELSFDKRVSKLKLSLANGRTIANITIDKQGNVEGSKSGLIYMPPSNTKEPRQGMIRIEMDSELMSGAIIEVTYELTLSNVSELDYVCEEYYKYGTHAQESELVKISASPLVDYLDKDWGFQANKNEGEWESIPKDYDDIIISDDVKKSDTIENREILYTEGFDEPMAPNTYKSKTLNVSKILTSSQDIELDNEVEINKMKKNGGRDIVIDIIPGNYVPGSGPKVERDDGMAETIVITPNTGANLNFVLPIMMIISAFVIVGVGVIFIKKKVLNK